MGRIRRAAVSVEGAGDLPVLAQLRDLTVLLPLLLGPMFLVCAAGCSRSSKHEVVIYTSQDQSLSESIFQQFATETGIRVLPVYDTEAAKTTGLVNRLIEEKEHPRADVFWSSEAVQTVILKRRDVLERYRSP